MAKSKRKRSRNRKGRYRPLVRALKLFVALARSRFGLTLPELVEESGCSRRTVYRYLETLEEAGVKIRTERRSLSGVIVRRIESIDGRRLSGVA